MARQQAHAIAEVLAVVEVELLVGIFIIRLAFRSIFLSLRLIRLSFRIYVWRMPWNPVLAPPAGGALGLLSFLVE